MRKLGLFFFIGLMAVVGLSALGTYLIMGGYLFASLLTFVFAFFVAYFLYDKVRQVQLRISQVLQGMAIKDYSSKIPKGKLADSISEPLQQVLEQAQTVKAESESMQIIYEGIIDSMDTGILILKERSEKIFFSNRAFFEILQLPRFTQWALTKKYLDTFNKYLAEGNWRMVKEVIHLKINGTEAGFSFRTYPSQVHRSKYLIVNLDPIQNILDRKEKEAWSNLMKVMSHEIINTIAPISSLAGNLDYLVGDEEKNAHENYTDIKKSIATIKKRTTHLLDFINTYRLLTELPTPQPTWFSIQELFTEGASFLSGLLEERNVKVQINVHPKGLRLFADKKQMEQVLINLMTNSVYALKVKKESTIWLTALQNGEATILTVKDNGHGIDDAIKKNIFVPFFTTRKNGSGIGLSLSKNIINAHNATLGFSSHNGQTIFKMDFKY